MIQRTRIKKRPQTRCKQTCKFFALLESRNHCKCWFKSEISSGWTTDLFSYMYFDECRTVLNFVFVFKFGSWKLWCVLRINGRYLHRSRNLSTLWLFQDNTAVICFSVQNSNNHVCRILVGIMHTLWIEFLGQLNSRKNLLLYDILEL